jgi:hypothetical protein
MILKFKKVRKASVEYAINGNVGKQSSGPVREWWVVNDETNKTRLCCCHLVRTSYVPFQYSKDQFKTLCFLAELHGWQVSVTDETIVTKEKLK